jgi:hypothetical protein
MDVRRFLGRRLMVGVAMYVLVAPFATAQEPALTKDQIKEFLLTAKVLNAKQSSKGITHTLRLTLSDGKITHDASFQPIDEHKSKMELANRTEFNFVDSYKYNIAAYTLAEMLGVEDMLPVYVERNYKGATGSLSWWLPVKMDEADRVKQKISIPDADSWNNQMYRIRVFDELVYDTDTNLTNVLIGEDWKIWRIDFTRAFRSSKDLKSQENLVRCDRQLLEKLKTLDGEALAQRTKRYLTKDEVKGVMARRDKIVTRFQQLVGQKGEASVLY